jgi:hypothetical protein
MALSDGSQFDSALWKMAEDYQLEAAKLDSAKSPDIGQPPTRS